MAKKKDKPQVINNIQKLNLEIDYDKLGKAIAKAIKESQSKQNDDILPIKKTNFFVYIWKILRNKEDTDGKMLSGSFALVVQLIFNAFFFLTILSSAFCFVSFIIQIVEAINSTPENTIKHIVNAVCYFMIAFASFLYSVIIKGASNDIQREKDRYYIISVFSGIVSFAALIVALVALFKGVG